MSNNCPNLARNDSSPVNYCHHIVQRRIIYDAIPVQKQTKFKTTVPQPKGGVTFPIAVLP